MLQIKELTYRIGGRTILANVTTTIPNGYKVGLVGDNGVGKTTLFRLIAGDVASDDGEIHISKKARLGYVRQELAATDNSLIENVLSSDQELATLEKAAKNATDPTRISELQARLIDIEAHTAKARAASILAGLGFDTEAQTKNLKEFSGGWQMRVALAGTLFSRPDILLLDEPTNHLDFESSMWLEQYLARFPGTLLIISHDRDLLNKAVRHIIHLENKTLTMYTGGYDQFVRVLDEQRTRNTALRSKQLKQRAHIQSFVDRFRAKATKARQAQSRIKALERMEPLVEDITSQTKVFDFPECSALPPPLLSIDNGTVGYDGEPVLKYINLQIDSDDRIALLGRNGNGKSTLIKLIAGHLNLSKGTFTRSNKLKIGYFSQHQTDLFNKNDTPYEVIKRYMDNEQETKIRTHLGSFGFEGEHANTPIGVLSGGEKSRLLFCQISLEKPHLLLLDEPTNHLDIGSRNSLIQAVNNFSGAVIVVSHDFHTIKLTAERLWLVANNTCLQFDGDLEDYRGRVLPEESKSNDPLRRREMNKGRNENNAAQKEKRKERARQRENTSHLRKAIKQSESRIERLTKKLKILEAALSRPETYQGSTDDMVKASKQLSDTRKALEKEERLWLEAEEALSTTDLIASSKPNKHS